MILSVSNGVSRIMNETDIKALKPRDIDYMEGCGNGLWLRVRTSGKKTFIIRRKVSGKTKIITLGDWPTLSLKQAVAMTGSVITPADATMNELVDAYEKAVVSKYARPIIFNAYGKRIREAMGRKRVSEITAKQAAELITASRGTPRSADALKTHLKAMFGLSIELGWRTDNPAAFIGSRVTGYTYEPRTRILTNDEIREIWSWPGDKPALLRFLLLTGLRISEGQTGDRDGDFWRMKKTKNGKPHWVFLSNTAKEQLKQKFTTGATNIQSWLRRKQKFAETAWTAHDLRRTFATLAMENGVLPHVVEKCLNHSLEGMLRVYAHAEMTEERIQASKTVEKAVLKIVKSIAQA